MATALAHEIKNPAAVALAHVNLLRLEDNNNALKNHLDHIEAALHNICALVKEMLTQNQDDPQEVDLYDILSEILDTYRAAWPNIVFSFNVSQVASLGLNGEAVLPCYGSPSSLRLIFSNLLKNAVEAIEATSPEGEIEITASYSGEHLNIKIRDTGAPSEARQKPHGNGLGLSICRRLATELGAKLSATHSPDGGFSVTISLVTLCPSFA
jgi:signal transduction histidine kinase